MFLVTSPIVINVPTRGLLAVETMDAIVRWLANMNIKRNMTSMFVNKKHRYNAQNSDVSLPLPCGLGGGDGWHFRLYVDQMSVDRLSTAYWLTVGWYVDWLWIDYWPIYISTDRQLGCWSTITQWPVGWLTVNWLSVDSSPTVGQHISRDVRRHYL